MEKDRYLILTLVKNLNEGDGAPLPMLDRHFFRILDARKIDSKIGDNLQLLREIESLEAEKLISRNDRNNYVITPFGVEWLSKNSSLKL